jgi:hypothetical protein
MGSGARWAQWVVAKLPPFLTDVYRVILVALFSSFYPMSFMIGRTPIAHVMLFQAIYLIGLLAMTGCSSKHSTVSATGTVLHKGKPLEGASVMFGRGGRDITMGEIAIGKTDADGRFALSTYIGPQEDLKGAVVGKYDVTISASSPESVGEFWLG